VIRNGLRWRDAPADYVPQKTIYNRFIRWSRLGVFNKIFSALSAQGGKPDQLMTPRGHCVIPGPMSKGRLSAEHLTF
jgi:putative transposase